MLLQASRGDGDDGDDGKVNPILENVIVGLAGAFVKAQSVAKELGFMGGERGEAAANSLSSSSRSHGGRPCSPTSTRTCHHPHNHNPNPTTTRKA